MTGSNNATTTGPGLVGLAVEVKFARRWYHGEIVAFDAKRGSNGSYHVKYEDNTYEWLENVEGGRDADVRLIPGVTYKVNTFSRMRLHFLGYFQYISRTCTFRPSFCCTFFFFYFVLLQSVTSLPL